jgi:hypothetical protein
MFKPSKLSQSSSGIWIVRLIIFLGIVVFCGISNADENPWQALAQKKNWKKFCNRARNSLKEHVRLKELRDVVFSPMPVAPADLPSVWAIQVAGLSIPIPRYTRPTFQLTDKPSEKHRLPGFVSLRILAPEDHSATEIAVIPMTTADVLRQTEARYGLSLAFLEQISNLYHLPKTLYESVRDQYQFGLSDIQCDSIEKSVRPLVAVLGKYHFQEYRRYLGIEQRGIEGAAAYHLSRPVEAVLEVERIYLNEKASQKTWVARLKMENLGAGVYIEVSYFFESYSSFINSVLHFQKAPIADGVPSELTVEVQKLNSKIR